MAARAMAAGELSEEQIMEKKQEIIETYKMMRTNISNIANKISELDGERNEHSLVVKALKDLDPKRRCFQSVGGVLLGPKVFFFQTEHVKRYTSALCLFFISFRNTERTIQDVPPQTNQNLESINAAIGALKQQMTNKEKESESYRAEYNINFAGQGSAEEGKAEEGKSSGGVLVQ